MPLSLNKLAKLLADKGFVPTKYIKYQGLCIFIEVVSLSSGVVAMIYIPSRFEIPIGDSESIVDVDLVDPENPDEYADDPEQVKQAFQSIDFLTGEETTAESHLSQKYKKKIHLRTGAQSSPEMLKDIIRQLGRLQYCVEDLPYHLVICKNAYIALMRNGEADCYIIKNHRGESPRTLRVVAELPVFHERGASMDGEVSQIYSGINDILGNNLGKHAVYMDALNQRKGNMRDFSVLIKSKKKEYQDLIKKYEGLLIQLDSREKSVRKELVALRTAPTGGTLINSVIHNQNQGGYERQIDECLEVKRSVIDHILKLRGALDEISLNADKVMFDNSVMMDKVFRNFDTLSRLCQQ